MFVYVFTNNSSSNKIHSEIGRDNYDTEYGKETYSIAPLPVASPSQITINKLSSSSQANRKTIVLLSRKVMIFLILTLLFLMNFVVGGKKR